MRSAIVTIFSPCLWQYAARSSARAIEPSSFWTSQITPAGISPASRASSTLASVWPVRSRTPPPRALSGCTWPPTTMSSGPLFGSIAVCMVCAWSCTLMPVVTPSRASMVTVNGVWCGVSFFADMSSRPSSSQRSGGSARQIQPPAWRVMKLIASGVTNCAAMTRSPSFSRSSSSTTTTILPEAMSSSASSMVANLSSARVGLGPMDRHQLLDVLGHDVHFQVHGGALLGSAQRGALQGFGDQGHVERRLPYRGYGERDPVDGDRALLDDVAQEIGVGGDRHPPGEAVAGDAVDRSDAVDVALDDVAAQARVGLQRQLEVDARPRLELAQRGAAQGLVHDIGAEQLAAAQPRRRQADAIDCDAVAFGELARERRRDRDPHAVLRGVHGGHCPQVLDQPGEHVTTPAAGR